MNEYPSSDFMRRVYNGFKFFVFVPFIYFLLVMVFASIGGPSELIEYLLPLLMVCATGYIVFVAMSFNEDVSNDIRTYVTRLKIGAIMWVVAALIQLLSVLTDGMGGEFGVIITILAVILTLAGYATIGTGYSILATRVGIRGSQLTAKGCYAVVAGVVFVALFIYMSNEIDKPAYTGWFGPDPEELKAYQTKMAWMSLFTVVSALSVFVGLCAIIFGSRFMIDSVELLEDAEEETTGNSYGDTGNSYGTTGDSYGNTTTSSEDTIKI